MKAKTVLTVVLLLVVFAALAAVVLKNGGREAKAVEEKSAAASDSQLAAAKQAPQRQIVATYFHNTVRCPSCLKIEKYSREAIEGNFADELKDGRLVYRMVNVDEKENAHYVKDYGLYTKHLVLSDMRDGKEVRFKDLPKVWDLLGDEAKFKEYVVTNVRLYLDGKDDPDAKAEPDAQDEPAPGQTT